jgi:hypothetical protein
MHIKSFYTQQHCYVSPKKPYTLVGFEPGSSCSWGGCDVHCATPPGQVTYFMNFQYRDEKNFPKSNPSQING